jgi:(R,R)-butanediol dehydrogenase/meso-butanediol dehydrogenase/diacetyl reductase
VVRRFGLQGGGYAEFALTRPNQCIRLPGDISLADGAIIEPLAVALHGVNLSGLKAGDKVLVLGAGRSDWPWRSGPGGWARAKVAVQDIADFQQDRALGMGADAFVVDPADPTAAPSAVSAARPTSCSNASASPG